MVRGKIQKLINTINDAELLIKKKLRKFIKNFA